MWADCTQEFIDEHWDGDIRDQDFFGINAIKSIKGRDKKIYDLKVKLDGLERKEQEESGEATSPSSIGWI